MTVSATDIVSVNLLWSPATLGWRPPARTTVRAGTDSLIRVKIVTFENYNSFCLNKVAFYTTYDCSG